MNAYDRIECITQIERCIITPFLNRVTHESGDGTKIAQRIGFSQWYVAYDDETLPEKFLTEIARAYLRAIMCVPPDTQTISRTLCFSNVVFRDSAQHSGLFTYMLTRLELYAARNNMRLRVESVINDGLAAFLIRRGYISDGVEYATNLWFPEPQ